VGTAPQLFQTLFLLIHHHANKGQLLAALEIAEQLLEVAEGAQEELPVVLAHWARGFLLHCLGRFPECLDSHGRVISLYDRERHAHLAHIFGMDVAVSSLAYSGVTQWLLGYSDRAQEYRKRALALARDLNHPNSLAHGLTQACQLAFIMRDLELLEQYVDELIRISTEHGVMLFHSAGLLFQVYAFSWRGRHEEAVELSQESFAAFIASGSTMGFPSSFAFHAEVHARAGHQDKGLPLISKALSMAKTGEEGLFLPEIHRIWGEYLLGQVPGSPSEAEAAFRRAIEVARGQGVKSLELRAAIPLSRLLHSQGRNDEARELLADIYGWFTEGLDTPDLKDAAALLKELS
jgi:predicted ATPase